MPTTNVKVNHKKTILQTEILKKQPSILCRSVVFNINCNSRSLVEYRVLKTLAVRKETRFSNISVDHSTQVSISEFNLHSNCTIA